MLNVISTLSFRIFFFPCEVLHEFEVDGNFYRTQVMPIASILALQLEHLFSLSKYSCSHVKYLHEFEVYLKLYRTHR